MKRFLIFSFLLLLGCNKSDNEKILTQPSQIWCGGWASLEHEDPISDRLFFSKNSAFLDKTAKTVLDKQAAWLKKYSNVAIRIEGYTDGLGSKVDNVRLGMHRAQNVKRYLVSKGISSKRIRTVSYGKERTPPEERIDNKNFGVDHDGQRRTAVTLID